MSPMRKNSFEEMENEASDKKYSEDGLESIMSSRHSYRGTQFFEF